MAKAGLTMRHSAAICRPLLFTYVTVLKNLCGYCLIAIPDHKNAL